MKRGNLPPTSVLDRDELTHQIEGVGNSIMKLQDKLATTNIMTSEYDDMTRDIRNLRIKAMKLRIRLENLGALSKYELHIIERIPQII